MVVVGHRVRRFSPSPLFFFFWLYALVLLPVLYLKPNGVGWGWGQVNLNGWGRDLFFFFFFIIKKVFGPFRNGLDCVNANNFRRQYIRSIGFIIFALLWRLGSQKISKFSSLCGAHTWMPSQVFATRVLWYDTIIIPIWPHILSYP